jgi:hypothetical protein
MHVRIEAKGCDLCPARRKAGGDWRGGLRTEHPQQTGAGQIYSGVFHPMLGSYRNIVLALVGLAALAIVAASYPYLKSSCQSQGYEAYHQPDASGLLPPLAKNEKVAPNSERAADRRSEQREEADLVRQDRSALAAERLLDLTRCQTAVSVAGFVAILLSLFFTGWAAMAAASAAKAADKAVEVTGDTAKRQLRAYVLAKDHSVEKFYSGGKPKFVIKIHNFGQTPAYEVRCRVLARCTDEDVDAYRFMMRLADTIGGDSNAVLGPGDFLVQSNEMKGPLDHEAWQLLVSGDLKMILAGVISYRDAFGRRRLSTFRYYLDPRGNFKDTSFDLMACGKGNKAN